VRAGFRLLEAGYFAHAIALDFSDGDQTQSGMERVQALADISHSVLYGYSNKTYAPIANPSDSAQLEGTSYHSPSYIRVRAVVWVCGEGQTDRGA